MTRLITKFNFGNKLLEENPELLRQLTTIYSDLAAAINEKVKKYATTVDPPNSVTPNDVNRTLDIGDVWVNTSSDNSWMMTSRTTDLLVTWTIIT